MSKWLSLFSHLVVSNSLWPQGLAAHQASLSFTISQSLLKLMSIESVMPSNHLILCHPLLLLPSVFPSIKVCFFFFKMYQLYESSGLSIGASASASVLPMNIQDSFPLRLTGLISLHPRDSQGFSLTPQFKNIMITFFMVQLSHPYMTTGKTIGLYTLPK